MDRNNCQIIGTEFGKAALLSIDDIDEKEFIKEFSHFNINSTATSTTDAHAAISIEGSLTLY